MLDSIVVKPKKGMTVRKSGRTMGLTKGTMNTILANIWITAAMAETPTTYKTREWVIAVPALSEKPFSAGGDSGSLPVTLAGTSTDTGALSRFHNCVGRVRRSDSPNRK